MIAPIRQALQQYPLENPLLLAKTAAAPLAHDFMNREIASCRCCEAKLDLRHKTFGYCFGDIAAAMVLVVGDYARNPQTLPQPAGSNGPGCTLLMQALLEAGVSQESVYYLNAINCALKSATSPDRKEIENCSAYLHYAIDFLNPAAILFLGPVAAAPLFVAGAKLPEQGTSFPVLSALATIVAHPGSIHEFADLFDNTAIKSMADDFLAQTNRFFQQVRVKYPDLSMHIFNQ